MNRILEFLAQNWAEITAVAVLAAMAAIAESGEDLAD